MGIIVFFWGLAASASGRLSAPIALALGLCFGLLLEHPFQKQSKRASALLLQVSVVALGFGMNLAEVARAGRNGAVITAICIATVIAIGLTLGRMLGVEGKPAFLISTGTAICGGSAIAAVGPIIEANEEQMAVSLATVFVLNSIALLIFPPIGLAVHLSPSQFGLWAALAIHDTSSVVGAAAKFGGGALALATTVKLVRALWIMPVGLGAAVARGKKTRVKIPWFIAFFILACIANTYLPFKTVFHGAQRAGVIGLTVTLFLIGTGISRQTIKRVGYRPMLQGVILWLFVAVTSLALIRHAWLHP
ncbi:MAG TPA: putative sulfate exporter family transporter [Terriglobales bacterium]